MRVHELPGDNYRLGVNREYGPGLADEILYPVVERKVTRTVGHLWWKRVIEVWEIDRMFDRYGMEDAKRWLKAKRKND